MKRVREQTKVEKRLSHDAYVLNNNFVYMYKQLMKNLYHLLLFDLLKICSDVSHLLFQCSFFPNVCCHFSHNNFLITLLYFVCHSNIFIYSYFHLFHSLKNRGVKVAFEERTTGCVNKVKIFHHDRRNKSLSINNNWSDFFYKTVMFIKVNCCCKIFSMKVLMSFRCLVR